MESAMSKPERKLTGRGVLIIAVCFFGVIIGVNVLMATLAVGGFPGLVTANPYAEAQRFDAELKAERALAWKLGAEWEAGELRVAVDEADGTPVRGLEVSVVIGRPATLAEDRELRLSPSADGYAGPADLGPGVWRAEITARRGDGAVYVITDQVYIPRAAG